MYKKYKMSSYSHKQGEVLKTHTCFIDFCGDRLLELLDLHYFHNSFIPLLYFLAIVLLLVTVFEVHFEF